MESTTGENEKKLLATILKERLIESKNTIIYKELIEEEMPIFLKNFLQNRVQKCFHTNEPFQIKNSKRYDLNYERIKKLKQELHEAFEEATLFSKEEITEIINRTIGLQFDLLINPQDTLIKIFYKNKSERTQTDILNILSGLIDKRVFIQQLIEKIKEFDQFHIIQEDFKKLLKETQEEVYQNNFISAFISDLKAFSDFVSHVKDTEEKSINKDVVKLLLEERELNEYYEVFNSISDNNDWIDIHDIASLLKEHINKKNSTSVENNIKEVDDDIENFIVPFVKTEKTGEEETEKDVDNNATELESDVVAIKEERDSKRHYPIIEAWKEPQDFIINRSMIEYQPEGPLAPLSSLIDEKSERLIRRKIFKKDDMAYDNFIKRLEEINNWKEAKQIIDDELSMRSIQPFSREALKLGDLVFNRYFPKKS